MSKCRVCFQFLKPPVKLLICGHSFCHNCMKRLVHDESICHVCMERFGEEEVIRKITCPVCRQSTQVTSDGIEALLPNYSLNTSLDRLLIRLGNKKRMDANENGDKQPEANDLKQADFDNSSTLQMSSFSIHLSPDYDHLPYHCLNDEIFKWESLCETTNDNINRNRYLKLFRRIFTSMVFMNKVNF